MYVIRRDDIKMNGRYKPSGRERQGVGIVKTHAEGAEGGHLGSETAVTGIDSTRA